MESVGFLLAIWLGLWLGRLWGREEGRKDRGTPVVITYIPLVVEKPRRVPLMRRWFASIIFVLAVALAGGSATLADAPRFEPGSPQVSALENPDAVYTPAGPGNPCPSIEFTARSAQAWWAWQFFAPVDYSAVKPEFLPGSVVLTEDQYLMAVALVAPGNTLPKAPRLYNPLNLPIVACK